MTRKDYILIARAFAIARPEKSNGERIVWLTCVCNVASALLKDNEKFNERKFLALCNGDSEI